MLKSTTINDDNDNIRKLINEKDQRLIEYQTYMKQESDNWKKQLKAFCERMQQEEHKNELFQKEKDRWMQEKENLLKQNN